MSTDTFQIAKPNMPHTYMLRPRKPRTDVADNVVNRCVGNRRNAKKRLLASSANQLLLVGESLINNTRRQNDYNDGRFDTAIVLTSRMYSQNRFCHTEVIQFMTDSPTDFSNNFIADTTKREWVMHKLTAASSYLFILDCLAILFLLITSGVWVFTGLLDMYSPDTRSSSNISSSKLTMPPSEIKFEDLNVDFLPAYSSSEKQSSMSAENKKQTKLLEESLQALAIRFNSTVLKEFIESLLLKYSADKTEMADFALETVGGHVVLFRCSPNFVRNNPLYSIFGIPLVYKSNSPRTAIQASVNAGECWSFAGRSGTLVIKLSHMINVTAFSMEHIPKSISPGGHINDAPKEFSVYSLSDWDDPEGVYLGTFIYDDNGRPLQQFFTQMTNAKPTQMIKLQISSNHDNLEYTCLYRFRVHGVLHTP